MRDIMSVRHSDIQICIYMELVYNNNCFKTFEKCRLVVLLEWRV